MDHDIALQNVEGMSEGSHHRSISYSGYLFKSWNRRFHNPHARPTVRSKVSLDRERKNLAIRRRTRHAQRLDDPFHLVRVLDSSFYSGGPAAPHENRAKLFMQQYPGIDVKVTGGFSNVLNEMIEKQMAEKKLQVDMTFFQTVQDFVKWKAQGKLMNFKADGFDQIYPNLRDADGAYMSFSANALTYAYNTAKVRSEDAPKCALDFLKPIFSGKVITCYPADDDATLYLLYFIVQKYGWGWMDKYIANKPNYVQGHLPVARSVADGENMVTFDASSSVWEFQRQGKLEVVWSAEDETPVFTLTGGIFKDAPHPNAAKLYVTWFLAKEQQGRWHFLGARRCAARRIQAANLSTRSPTTIGSSWSTAN